jgi:hypothetical protein
MKELWRADDSFWTRLPKSELLCILDDSPAMDDLSNKQRETQRKALSQLKKDELGTRAPTAYAQDFYMPDMFIREPAPGCVRRAQTADDIAA